MSSRHKKTASSPAGEQKLRIIGGRWRGRVLPFPDVEGLRPTGNRVRETLFNWLMPALPGSHCLDLFAGSGALAFEALSRGAATCTLVELNPLASRQLQTNSERLQCATAKVVGSNAVDFLQSHSTQSYDIVFIDPPFAHDLWVIVIDLLQTNGWLKRDALVYLEMPRDKQLSMPAHWQLHRHKQAGQVQYCLYRYETNLGPKG